MIEEKVYVFINGERIETYSHSLDSDKYIGISNYRLILLMPREPKIEISKIREHHIELRHREFSSFFTGKLVFEIYSRDGRVRKCIFALTLLGNYDKKEDRALRVWRGKNGQYYEIKEMDTSHIFNCINHIRQRIKFHTVGVTEIVNAALPRSDDNGIPELHQLDNALKNFKNAVIHSQDWIKVFEKELLRRKVKSHIGPDGTLLPGSGRKVSKKTKRR